MAKIEIKYLPLASLAPYANNFNEHSEAQIDEIAASINEFGFLNPIAIYGNEIVAGHGRYLAAKKLNLAKVPCIRLDHLSDRQRRAYVIADNKIARNSTFNFEKLAAEVDALSQLDFDLSILGFDEQELDALLKDAPGILPPDWQGTVQVDGYNRRLPGQAGEDEYDPDGDGVHAPQRTSPGDLWQLGDHFLLCGDSKDKANIDRLLAMAPTLPRLLVTDPPYGVEYDPSWRVEALANLNNAVSEVENDDTASWLEVWELASHFCDVAYVWHGGIHADVVKNDLQAARFNIRAQIIWAKDGMVISRVAYHWQHEPCWYAVKNGATAGWIGDRSQTTLWKIPKPKKSETGHSTQKPVECMGRPMQNHSGDVFDPFVGSGSTIIAAEQLGRRCYAIELKPRHCDIVLDRWESFTGQKAVLCGK